MDDEAWLGRAVEIALRGRAGGSADGDPRSRSRPWAGAYGLVSAGIRVDVVHGLVFAAEAQAAVDAGLGPAAPAPSLEHLPVDGAERPLEAWRSWQR